MLKGLVSFVTGGASGLGKQTVQHLAKQGGKVLSIDLPASRGQEIAEDIGENVMFVPCDVTSEADVSNALSICQKEHGRLDVVVNCAGLSRAFLIATPHLQKCMSHETFDVCYRSCVYGTFNVVRLASQLMSKNGPKSDDGQRGVMINTGALASEHGIVGQCAFAAAKGAIAAMTLPIAREFSPLGIRVVTISPGIFDTPVTDIDSLTKPAYKYYQEQTLFPRRFGKPEEFAEMVQSVVLNPMINGEIIKLTGGIRFHSKSFAPSEDHKEEEEHF